jgi:hypothetical protein
MLICWINIVVFALPLKGAMYTIQYGVGDSPFVRRPPTLDYQVEPTGSNEPISGPHGFVLHHNGVDTYVNIEAATYYVAGLLVNDSGQVTGRYNWNAWGPPCQAFFWDQGQLTLCSDTRDNHMVDMNNLGQVVGNFGVGIKKPFVWDHESYSLFDLSQYLQQVEYNGHNYPIQDEAYVRLDGINDQGQLSGVFDPTLNGDFLWFIATPVPEPSAVALAGLGYLAVILRRSSGRFDRHSEGCGICPPNQLL